MPEQDTSTNHGPQTAPYRVLARKYRPANFDALVGQEALVRTLTNAFNSGRLAQAYMLSGVRGIGKTTTARIIARALNCVGPDGGGGPTPNPCGVCEHCRAIAEDRHVDVLEMDAASRTGVDDIRELIESARYRPTSARFKVYIIDEVHMLSKNAFNALLKTLEEPPEHVRFIFATTEIRKVPVTVLSRCQRFDLRRVDAEVLRTHFANIAHQENVTAAEDALQVIARAADGSVRDGLSLLDQAIAHTSGTIDAGTVREMLGLADRTVVFDLYDAVMRGDAPTALGLISDLYTVGGDPALVFEDLLDLTHWLTRIKIAPEAADAPGIPEAERIRGKDMAGRLSMSGITRAWQMLLKGLGEIRVAPSPLQAAEMVLVRLIHASSLPTPEEALKVLQGERSTSGEAPPPRPSPPAAPAGPSSAAVSSRGQTLAHQPGTAGPSAALRVPETALGPQDPVPAKNDPASFREVVELIAAVGHGDLYANLKTLVHLVHFEPGKIELRLDALAPSELPQSLTRLLNEHTQRRWMVSVARHGGEATLEQQDRIAHAKELAEVAKHPLIREIMEIFPGATIEDVRAPSASPDAEPSSETNIDPRNDNEDAS